MDDLPSEVPDAAGQGGSFGTGATGIGIDNIFNKKDNRPLNKNFALYSPGRSVVVSLALRLK